MQTIYVDKIRTDAFSSLQEAVLSVPDDRQETVRILVAPGIYEEKIFIRKENLEIVGENPETTVFRYGDGARKPRPDHSGELGTFNTAVILLAGKNLRMENITVENTAGPGRTAGQALALYAAADRCSFHNCRFLGWQDTVFAGEAVPCKIKNLMLPDFFCRSSVPVEYPVLRNYFDNCYISGDVDFIFGPNVVFFDQCEIFSKKRQSEDRAFITAASTPAGQEFGLVFSRCRLTGDGDPASVYLGRPWRDFAKTAFVSCHMDGHICPEGWQNWGKARAEVLCSYVEYDNAGPGARTQARASFSRQLAHPGLAEYYSRENVLAGEDGWNGE
nr:pectinesterase family protein [uncultured Acetatifactor sp.]